MVYYHKLWKMLKEKDITQRELAEGTGVSTATLTKMRKGYYVSLEVVDKIGEYLGCGFEDLITSVPPDDTSVIAISKVSDYESLNDNIREALLEYMRKTNSAPINISQQTSLAVNTIKSFLRGNSISSYSFLKLCKLGNEFTSIINQESQKTR